MEKLCMSCFSNKDYLIISMRNLNMKYANVRLDRN